MSEKGKIIKCTLLEFHDADEFWDKLVMVDSVITSLPTPNSVTDIPVNTTNYPTQSFAITYRAIPTHVTQFKEIDTDNLTPRIDFTKSLLDLK